MRRLLNSLALLICTALACAAHARNPRGAPAPVVVGAPVVTSLSTTAVSPGTVVTITGTNLSGINTANSGLFVLEPPVALVTDGTISVTNNTTATYTVPADAGPGLLYVGDGTNNFTYGTALTFTATTVAPVPTSVTAFADNNDVVVQWVGSRKASGYHIKRSTTSGGGAGYTTIATYTPPTGPNYFSVIPYSDATASNGTTYYYVVSSLDAAGESANSSQASATPAAVSTPSGGIYPITPASGGVGTVFTGTGLGSLTNANSPASSGVTIISGGNQIGTIWDGAINIVNSTTATYTMPADGATGQLFLGNSAGAAYAYYALTFTPTVASLPPTNLQQSSSNAEVDLSWSGAANAASYNVMRGTTSGGPYSLVTNVTNALLYSDQSVTNGVTYYYVVQGVNSAGTSLNSVQVTATPAVPPPGTVTVTVTAGTTQAISPYIYGVNGASPLSNQFPSGTSSSVPVGTAFDRFGGDRLTAYNWETNNSNAGADYLFENDAALATTPNSQASAVTQRITWDQAHGMWLLMTFQMLGLVSADASGPTNSAGPPNNPGRFDSVQFAKGSAFVINPTPASTVYMDEFAYNVNNSFPGVFTTSTDPVFLELDNEPDIWYSTHPEVQTTTEITAPTFITESISLATALKNQYVGAKVFGPAISGWTGLTVWAVSQPVSWTPTGANWMIDDYASSVHSASVTYGHPLVDIFDFHWYPQITDPVTGGAITGTNGTSLTNAQIQAIAQAPRSMYDSTFVENSWIPSTIAGGAINLLPRFNAKLAAANPGMQLAITEYYPGGGGHIAGTMAEADMLGAFGANNVFATNLWPLVTSFPAITGAFTAFRNFDGAGSNFGDTSVLASSSAIANVSAYVSTDSTHAGRVVMVLINRSNGVQNTTVSGQTLTGTAHIYQMTQANIPSGATPMAPIFVGTQAASGSSITFALPQYSVTTVDIH